MCVLPPRWRLRRGQEGYYLPEEVRDAPVVIRSQLPAEYTPLFEAGSQGEMDA
jgi:hypothetical protein